MLLLTALVFSLLFSFCQSPAEKSSAKLDAPPQPRYFERIVEAHSQINFKPEITESFKYNFFTDPYQYNGGGVVAFDANNDGLQDLFFTYRFNGCRLYLNRGDFRFEDISEKSGILRHSGLKTGATPVDINADGWMDLYVCRTWLSPLPERRNLLFVNNQDGTFREAAAEYGLDDLSASQCAAFFDYDLDGDLDLYVVNHPVDFKNINTPTFKQTALHTWASAEQPRDPFESDRLYRNEGGKFTDVTQKAGILNRAYGLSVVPADFNGDGWPDIFVGNDFIMPDFLYINQRNGTFREEAASWFPVMANHSMGTDVADINNDGLPDLFVPDMLGSTLERQKSLMTTMISERYDGLLAGGYGHQQMRNVLQLNRGNGTFGEIACLSGAEASEWSWSPLIADFDLDGFKDIFLTTGVYRDLNDLDFFFYTADSVNHLGGLGPTTVGENFSKFADIMSSLPMRNKLYRHLGQGRLAFSETGVAWGLDELGFTNGAAYADLDNDGDLDLIANRTNDTPLLYKNQAAQQPKAHWLQIKCLGTPQNPTGIGAKIRVLAAGQVYSAEIGPSRGFYSASEPIFQVGLGTTEAFDEIQITWPGGLVQTLPSGTANQRIVLDIKNATRGTLPSLSAPALAFSFEKIASPSNFSHKENEFDDYRNERLLMRRYSRLGPGIASADLDGDGFSDVVVTGARGQATRVFFGKNSADFTEKKQPDLSTDADYEDVAVLLFDADGDGDSDLFCVAGGNEAPAGDQGYRQRLYINDGKGIFSKASFPSKSNSGACARAFDMDSDGDLDLFVGGRVLPQRWPSAPESFVYRNEGSGRFVEVTQEVAPEFSQIGMVTDIQFGDLDGDKKPEMVVVSEWMPISVFSWKNGQFSAQKNLSPPESAGLWNTVALVDLDGDGDLDVAAGNEGLNSRLRCTPAHPMRVYADDFDKNGSLDPIVAVFEGGKYVPLAQRNELGMQLPGIVRKKYTRYRPYSTASMEEIFGKTALDKAQQLQIQHLASGWWENAGAAWTFHAFPDQAQMSCIKSILVHDFDQDGRLDVFLAGNDSGNHVETGPYLASAGVFLLNKGKNDWISPSNQATGMWADGEVRSILRFPSSKEKKEHLWIVARNNATFGVFREKMRGVEN